MLLRGSQLIYLKFAFWKKKTFYITNVSYLTRPISHNYAFFLNIRTNFHYDVIHDMQSVLKGINESLLIEDVTGEEFQGKHIFTIFLKALADHFKTSIQKQKLTETWPQMGFKCSCYLEWSCQEIHAPLCNRCKFVVWC